MTQYQLTNNNNKALVPNFLGLAMDLNRLVRIGHMYFYLHSIQSKVTAYVTSLIDMFFFFNYF